MNVYYLTTQDGHRFFYYDASETAVDKTGAGASESAWEFDPEFSRPTDKTGAGASKSAALWGWAERKWNAVQKGMDDPKGGVARWIGRVWNWLHSFSHPDETMLALFGSASEVVLHYPASLPVERVQKDWNRYLKRRSRSHAFWMVVNAVVVPFGVLLAILPGPNVIGFWFFYRAVYHFLAVRGVRRVRRGAVATRWRAEVSLDAPVSLDPNGGPSHEALADGAKLGDYLHWSKPSDSTLAAQPENPNSDAGQSGG